LVHNWGLKYFRWETDQSVDIAKAAVEYAKSRQYDLVIIDTAGRLHINEELMEELQNIKEAVRPQEILLVVDSMTGQDAVNVAESLTKNWVLTVSYLQA